MNMSDATGLTSTLVPTLATDLSDYAPGSTATITASGCAPGATLAFDAQIFGADGALLFDVQWTTIDGATTDADGSADGSVLTSLAILPTYANTTITLTATEVAAPTAS